MESSVADRAEPRATRLAPMAIADCDIHPNPKSIEREVYPFLEPRWREYLDSYGGLMRQGAGTAYPKGQPDAMRLDAWPPGGGRAGSDLDFMRRQHLDPNNVQLGVLSTLRSGHSLRHPGLSAAYARAINDWQVEMWTSREPRLKASVSVPFEDPEAAAEEIDRRAGDPNFVQVLLLSRTVEPMGNRRYWPVFAAAERANLPVAVHAFGSGGHAITGTGWPSFYIEDMVNHAAACQAGLTSMIVEGVFEAHPKLRFILIEAGFAWLPPLAWRLDRIWTRLKSETPHLKRAPSEVIREHVWITTQPMEEPEKRDHLADTIGWIGWDRLLFATDYPHWDFDDPARALMLSTSKENRRKFFLDNARAVYGLA